MDKRRKHHNLSLVTHHQSSEIADPGDRALDFPAAFVPTQLSSVLSLGFNTLRPVWANQVDASFGQTASQRIGVGGLVVNQPHWVLSGASSSASWHRHLVQRSLDQSDFIWCGRGKEHSQRNTLAVCHHHKLRTLSAFRLADACAPFFAGKNVPSAKVSYQRRRRLTSSSASSARHAFNQIPCSSQSCNRRQHVLGEGNRLGRSFQRAPLRNTQRMPSNTRRFAIGVRPPLGDGFGSGNNGAIFAHCRSVSSDCSRAIGKSPFDSPLYASGTYFSAVS
jgi:hypothetical protein